MVRTAQAAGAYRFGLRRRLAAPYDNLQFHPSRCFGDTAAIATVGDEGAVTLTNKAY